MLNQNEPVKVLTHNAPPRGAVIKYRPEVRIMVCIALRGALYILQASSNRKKVRFPPIIISAKAQITLAFFKRKITMTFCDETARLAKGKLAVEYQSINVERVVIGVLFSGLYDTE